MSFKRFYQISTTLLILLMMLATLAPLFSELSPDHTPTLWKPLATIDFYQSGLFILLWVAVILALIAFSIFGRHSSGGVRVLHLSLALTFTLIGFEKSTDQRFLLVLEEHQPIEFRPDRTALAPIKLHLIKFEILYHPGSATIAQYHSTIVVNDRDTLLLAINHPIKIGPYRLLLNAYQLQPNYMIYNHQDTLYAAVGDSLKWQDTTLTILPPDTNTELPMLLFKGQIYRPALNGMLSLERQPLWIKPAGQRYVNVIEVVHATKPKIIMLFGLFYLGSLANVLWWKTRL